MCPQAVLSACSIQFRAAASRAITVVPMTVFELHWGSAANPERTIASGARGAKPVCFGWQLQTPLLFEANVTIYPAMRIISKRK
jgi:hypothetical protein